MLHRNRLSYGLVALVLVTALLLGAFPASASATPSGIPVLILQDGDPWGRSSFRTALLPSLGYAPTVAHWSQVGTGSGLIHLADFKYVYIPSCQSPGFYGDYVARSSELADWVSAGGHLVFSVCTQGQTLTLPGGLKTEFNLANNNYIVDASHPIVTGELSDGIALTDADLYGTMCSHIDMNSLPAGATVILRDQQNPTLVEYPYGAGRIVASGLTWEFYTDLGSLGDTGSFAKRAYDDLFLYSFGLLHVITVKSTTGGTVTPSGSIRVVEGFSKAFVITADMGFRIVAVAVDGQSISISDPRTMTVTVADVLSDRTLAVSFAANDFSAPTISLSRLGTAVGVTNWVDGTVPSLTVDSSPFPLTFDLSDDSGSAKWSITVNNRVVVDPWGFGTVTYPVPLTSGRNDVAISAVDASGNTATQKLVITLDGSGPVLTLDSALPATVASPTLAIAGTVTDATSGVRSFSINGTPVVLYADGSFREQLSLKNGDNIVSLEAIDRAGHTTSQTFTVKYGAASSSASSSLNIVLTIGKTTMNVNGMPVAMDAAPVIQSGRTMLPIRALIQTLGGRATWNGSSKTATVTLGDRTVAVTIGSTTALVNGKTVSLDVVPFITGGRTFLPLRFIAENLGLDLAWEPVSRTISFTYWP